MTPGRATALYGALVRLYPRGFRDHYGADLVQHFNDLASDRGVRAAWGRSAIDLLVTVPRYRLETFMPTHQSTAAVRTLIVLLAAVGVLSVLVGFLPGAVLFVAAVALGIAQRSALAQAIRTPDEDRRRRRFRLAAMSTIVTLASIVSFAIAIRDDEIGGLSLVLHNLIGVPAMVCAVAFLIAALATPRTGPPPWLPAGVTALAVATAIPLADGGELSAVWWSVMALSGILGVGLVMAGVLSLFTSRDARAASA